MRAWIFACGRTARCTCWKPTPIPICPPPRICRNRRARPAWTTTSSCTASCNWARTIRPRGAPSKPSSLAVPAVHPGNHGVVPLNAVGRLQDPVIFVGEIQELARYAAALQGGEHRQALCLRNPIIETALNHQHGRLPLAHIVDRIVLGVAGGI